MKSISSVRFCSLLAVSCAFASVASSPSKAVPVTFAQYIQTDGAQQQWTVSSLGGTTSVSASGAVFFSFSNVPGVPFTGPERAIFTLSATSLQVGNCGVNCGPGDSFVQPGYVGTFSFIDDGPNPGANLLSGTFATTGSPSTTGGQFSSSVGSSGGSFNASATAGNLDQLIMTSAYLPFLNGVQQNASWSLSSLIPNFATETVSNNQALPAGVFNAAGTGTFSFTTDVINIPEPSTLGVLTFGLFALIGIGIARQQTS